MGLEAQPVPAARVRAHPAVPQEHLAGQGAGVRPVLRLLALCSSRPSGRSGIGFRFLFLLGPDGHLPRLHLDPVDDFRINPHRTVGAGEARRTAVRTPVVENRVDRLLLLNPSPGYAPGVALEHLARHEEERLARLDPGPQMLSHLGGDLPQRLPEEVMLLGSQLEAHLHLEPRQTTFSPSGSLPALLDGRLDLRLHLADGVPLRELHPLRLALLARHPGDLLERRPADLPVVEGLAGMRELPQRPGDPERFEGLAVLVAEVALGVLAGARVAQLQVEPLLIECEQRLEKLPPDPVAEPVRPEEVCVKLLGRDASRPSRQGGHSLRRAQLRHDSSFFHEATHAETHESEGLR